MITYPPHLKFRPSPNNRNCAPVSSSALESVSSEAREFPAPFNPRSSFEAFTQIAAITWITDCWEK